jgi:hypothetical protein
VPTLLTNLGDAAEFPKSRIGRAPRRGPRPLKHRTWRSVRALRRALESRCSRRFSETAAPCTKSTTQEPGSSRTPYRPVFSCEPCGLPDEVEGGDGAATAPAGFFTRSRIGSSTKVA